MIRLPIELNATVYLMVRPKQNYRALLLIALINLRSLYVQVDNRDKREFCGRNWLKILKILHNTRSHNIVLNLIERSVMLCIAGTSDFKVLKHNQR